MAALNVQKDYDLWGIPEAVYTCHSFTRLSPPHVASKKHGDWPPPSANVESNRERVFYMQ